MNIIAIETATEACSAALYHHGEIISRYELAPRKHTQLILPMLDAVLAEAGVSKHSLDAIAFGRGPGAFTGLRIAVGIAQGLALAIDKPVIPVSTLATMAQQLIEETDSILPTTITQFAPAIDARMGEVYWGKFEAVAGEAILIDEEGIAKPEILNTLAQPNTLVFGSGWEAYAPECMPEKTSSLGQHCREMFPNAYYVAKLAATAFARGEAIDAADAEPVYLRNDVAKKKAEQGKTPA